MPEICEVVFTQQYLLSKIKGRTLSEINVLSGRYTHEKIQGIGLISKYTPLTIEDIDSKGKFLWFKLKAQNSDTHLYILNTFGLTGGWSFTKSNDSRVQFNIKNKEDTKEYTLYYHDQRNFGTLAITDKYNVLKEKLDSLGPDLLKTNYDLEEFTRRITKYKSRSNVAFNTPIVKVLMDQSEKGIGSGLGNYLVPSVLYRAKIAPHRPIGSLTDDEIKNLYNATKYIIKLCYYNNKVGYMEAFKELVDKHKEDIKKGKFPNYLSDIDTGDEEFKFEVYRQKKDPSGNPVKIAKIITGRSTYWVPAVQK